MPGLIRNIGKKLLVAINAGAGIAMLLLYTLPFSNQNYFWLINIIALAFPLLLAIQLFFLVFWIIFKPKMVFLPIFICLLSYKLIFSVFGIQSAAPDNANPSQSYRLLSWNVHMLNFFEYGGKPDPKLIQKIKSRNVDIFCAQELVFSLDESSSFTLDKLKQRLGFNYAVAANDRAFGVHTNIRTSKERYHPFCLAIFSKHPIVKWKKVQSIPEYNHTFLWADIKIDKDTFRVFNIHLQSMYFAKNDYEFIEHIDQQNVDQVGNRGKNIMRKLKNANYLRALQILDIKKEILKSPHPVLLSGDFNDVPNSYAYQQMRRLLKDAFLERSQGIGRTFLKLSPTLRIDYIFSAPDIQLHSFNTHKWQMSDHNAIEASFSIPKN